MASGTARDCSDHTGLLESTVLYDRTARLYCLSSWVGHEVPVYSFPPRNNTCFLSLSKSTCIAFVTKAAEIGLMNSFCLAGGLQNTQGQGLCSPISKYQAAFPWILCPLQQLLFRTDALSWPCLIQPSRKTWNSISVSLIYVESGTDRQMAWCAGASRRCNVHYCV